MMTTYRVERMTVENFGRMMRGEYDYTVEKIDITAESKEDAVAKAKKDGYVVNKDYVKTVEEIEKAEREKAEYLKAQEEKAEKAKAKRAEKMAQPGAKAKANYKRKNTEIKKMLEEIERLQKEVKKAERAKANYAKQYKEETGKELV